MALLLVREIAYSILRRAGDFATPALLFILMFQLWHLFASPLGSSVRLFFAMAMAVVVMTTVERLRDAQISKAAARRQVSPGTNVRRTS
jgi:hypothetical protein